MINFHEWNEGCVRLWDTYIVWVCSCMCMWLYVPFRVFLSAALHWVRPIELLLLPASMFQHLHKKNPTNTFKYTDNGKLQRVLTLTCTKRRQRKRGGGGVTYLFWNLLWMTPNPNQLSPDLLHLRQRQFVVCLVSINQTKILHGNVKTRLNCRQQLHKCIYNECVCMCVKRGIFWIKLTCQKQNAQQQIRLHNCTIWFIAQVAQMATSLYKIWDVQKSFPRQNSTDRFRTVNDAVAVAGQAYKHLVWCCHLIRSIS